MLSSLRPLCAGAPTTSARRALSTTAPLCGRWHINGIPFSATADSLRTGLVSASGVSELLIFDIPENTRPKISDGTFVNRGFMFIEVADEDDAKIAGLDGSTYEGRSLGVKAYDGTGKGSVTREKLYKQIKSEIEGEK